MRLSWLQNAYSRPLFWHTCKVGQTDQVLARYQGSLAGLCVQDYKSLCAAVMIHSTLVNIQTHIHTHTPFYINRQHFDQLI